ncbi:MAG: hypothetical protein JNJ83_17940 [Verrucomicrobiaceae bacterium]|nr:hypothetical protein [Verrucomicrobiaceae bacterium]
MLEVGASSEPATITAPKTRGTGDAVINVEQARRDIVAAAPDVVGIGNSMMFTRLGKSPVELSALSGKKFFFLYKNGSDAPIWYLALKNIIAESGARPKAILLFVRDNELTAEFSSENEGAAPYLTSLRSPEEPELDNFMQKSGNHPTSMLGLWFTFPTLQEKASSRLTDLALDLGGGGTAKKAMRFMLTERFGLDHLRQDLGSEFKSKDSNVPDVAGVERSLLPHILGVTKRIGAKLIVFRIKRRPDATTQLPPEPAAMRAYSESMGRWLKEHGAVWFDETYDEQIKLSDYLDGDHISPARMEWYRSYFWQRTKELFP